MMALRSNLTDRAKRYRAQNNVRGEKRCVLCGSTRDLQVMHLDGNEDHGEQSNLAYGCRSCNQVLAAAFKRIGAGRPTNQYNPAKGIPTFEQYAWAVSTHTRGAHDEAGAIIHATPKHKRIEYAKRIAGVKRERGTDSSVPEWARNPGGRMPSKLDRCVKAVKKRGGAVSPYAVCKAGMKGNPREIFLKESSARKRYDELLAKGVDVGIARDPITGQWHVLWSNMRRGNPGSYYDVVLVDQHGKKYPVEMFSESQAEARRAALSYMPSDFKVDTVRPSKRKNPRNPAEASAAMSERFHGRPVMEVKEIDERVHYHTHLAELGELERLKVRACDGAIVRLEDFDGALLCSNEDGTQLYIRGGDQSVDPEDFGVDEPYHDKEELGEVVEIRYFTTKDHLGDQGGEATYYHEFGEEDKAEGLKPRRPHLVYSVRDQLLSLVGGGYKVEADGIVN